MTVPRRCRALLAAKQGMDCSLSLAQMKGQPKIGVGSAGTLLQAPTSPPPAVEETLGAPVPNADPSDCQYLFWAQFGS